MGLFGNSKEKEIAKAMAPQWLKIASESTRLVNTTKDPKVFFSRYDLLIETLEKLVAIERYVKFSGMPPRAMLKQVQSERENQTSIFIDRSFEKLMEDISGLKTPKAKGNRVDKYFSSMEAFSRYLTDRNKDKLDRFESKCRSMEFTWN